MAMEQLDPAVKVYVIVGAGAGLYDCLGMAQKGRNPRMDSHGTALASQPDCVWRVLYLW